MTTAIVRFVCTERLANWLALIALLALGIVWQ
jgi:hypothetical protein